MWLDTRHREIGLTGFIFCTKLLPQCIVQAIISVRSIIILLIQENRKMNDTQ